MSVGNAVSGLSGLFYEDLEPLLHLRVGGGLYEGLDQHRLQEAHLEREARGDLLALLRRPQHQYIFDGEAVGERHVLQSRGRSEHQPSVPVASVLLQLSWETVDGRTDGRTAEQPSLL